MTTYTKAQLATRILKDLGLVGADETPTPEDQAWVEETITSELIMLSQIGLPIWNGSEVSIPDAYLTILSRRIGLSIAPSFGLTDLATAQLAMREAERYIALLASPTAGMPRSLKTNDAAPSRGQSFNFSTGR